MRGAFITFEGGEGTGKSTQMQLLADRLRQSGVNVTLTREPGGSPGAEALRHVLLSGLAERFGPDTEALLFAAAREDHVRRTILPSLERGDWVLCDRFVDSTRVYQGQIGHADASFIKALEKLSVGAVMPDVTLVLDLDPTIGTMRAAKRRGAAAADRFEREGAEFHRALRESFRELTVREPARCILIDASGAAETVSERIWQAVAARLPVSAHRSSA